MQVSEFRAWYADYFAEFVALARGEREDVANLLAWWGAPLVFSTAAGCTYLLDDAQVLAALQQQIHALRSAGYDRTEELSTETTALNDSALLHRLRLVRLRADGSQIAEMEVTYLVTDAARGPRFSAVIVH